MRLGRVLGYGLVLVLCAACGEKRQNKAPWPAAVVQIGDVSESERASVIAGIARLNDSLGTQAVKVGTAGSADFSIIIRQVQPSEENQNRAGLATFDSETCEVELSSEIFEDRKNFFESVLWHELGHCAGLGHDSKEGEVMFRSASPTNQYTPEALQRFFKAFASSAGLVVK